MKHELIGILKVLFGLYSPSTQESRVIEYCYDHLKKSGWMPILDGVGNLMAQKRSKRFQPLLNAHFDTVQEESDRDGLGRTVFDPMTSRFENEGVMIGCDDKAGLAAVLYLAKHCTHPFKILFTVQEEIGTKGVQRIPDDFYRDVCWAFTLDRRGSSDIISRYRDRVMCSRGFLDKLREFGKRRGCSLEEATGTMADTYYISGFCPSVNLSVGYYNAHTRDDFQDLNDLIRIIRVVWFSLARAEELEQAGKNG